MNKNNANEYSKLNDSPTDTVNDPVFSPFQGGTFSTTGYVGELEKIFGKIIKELPPAQYKMITVEGSSMEPTLHPGDRLLCREISIEEIGEERAGDPTARIYAFDTNRMDLFQHRPSGRWVKRLVYREDTGYVNCYSDNMNNMENFHTFRLKKKEIVRVFYPVMVISGNMCNPHRDIHIRMGDMERRIEMLENKQ